jgi:hypothetical protein
MSAFGVRADITQGWFSLLETIPLLLFATGLGALGLLGLRRKRKSNLATAL